MKNYIPMEGGTELRPRAAGSPGDASTYVPWEPPAPVLDYLWVRRNPRPRKQRGPRWSHDV